MQMLQRSIIKFVFEGVDDFYVFGRLAGGGHAFFFAAFPGTFVACFCGFKRSILSGEVNLQLTIAFRPLFEFFDREVMQCCQRFFPTQRSMDRKLFMVVRLH